MDSAYGNTRMARLLLRLAGIGNVVVLFLICSVSASGTADLLGLLGVVAGADVAVGWYAYCQGVLFEWRVGRVWKRVCHGIGFTGEGVSILRSVRAGIASHGRYYVETQTKTIYPKLREVHGTWESFTGMVTFLDGQTLEEYNAPANANAFALAFNCRYVGFERTENGLLRIRVGEVPVPGAYNYGQIAPNPSQAAQLPQTGNVGQGVPIQNVIQQVVPSVYTAPQLDYRVANVWAQELALLRACPMAKDIDSKTWYMPIEGQHVLIAARTGGGKASWIWSLVLGLEPARHVGLVKFWGIDPKRLELAIAGTNCWDYYADTDVAMVELLEQAVSDMFAVGDKLKGYKRKFTPSRETPLNVVVIDELGYLSSLLNDRKLQARADNAIKTLLNQGRANSFSVVGAVQDVRKSTVDYRAEFPIKIVGGLNEAELVDLVLGKGMREAGALADQIPLGDAGAGVAYVLDAENTSQPKLVRAAWVSDDDIRGMASGVLRPKPQPGMPSGSVWEQPGVKDENLSGQLDWNGQPFHQWQYKVE